MWFNTLMLILDILENQAVIDMLPQEYDKYILGVVAIVNMILRSTTSTKLVLTAKV